MILAAVTVAAAIATPPPKTEPMPNLYRPPTRCGPLHDEVARQIRTATGGRRGGIEYAVMRQVDGCMVPAPIGYHPDYLAPGAADQPPISASAPKP